MFARVAHPLSDLRNGDTFGLLGQHVSEQFGRRIDDLGCVVDAIFDDDLTAAYEFAQLVFGDPVGIWWDESACLLYTSPSPRDRG